MALLIRNGRIVTATDDYTADIYCADQTITRQLPAGRPRVAPKMCRSPAAGSCSCAAIPRNSS